MFSTGKFNASKLKLQLRMASSQIQISSNKKTALLKQNMREISMFLNEDPPKEEKARLRTEAFILDDNMTRAYDILKLQCDMLVERVRLIDQSKKKCPLDLLSCVATLIYAASFVNIKEFSLMQKQFRNKYGKRFEEDAVTNKTNIVNEKIVLLLNNSPAELHVVEKYMVQICKQFVVNWAPIIGKQPPTATRPSPDIESSPMLIPVIHGEIQQDSNLADKHGINNMQSEDVFFITMAEAPKSQQMQEKNGDKETPPIPEYVVETVLVDEEFSLRSPTSLGRQAIEYAGSDVSNERTNIDCLEPIPLPTAPVEPGLFKILPQAPAGKLSEIIVLDKNAKERMNDSGKEEEEEEETLFIQGRKKENVLLEVTESYRKNSKNNKLLVEENGTEDAKICLPSDCSISISVKTQETDELIGKENLIYNTKNKMLPVLSTIYNEVEKIDTLEMQQNRRPESFIRLKENNDDRFRNKSEKKNSPEVVKNKAAKLSTTSPRSNKPRSSPNVSATRKSNFATIAEAVEALKQKREKKKNCNKVAPVDVKFGGNGDLDISAVKIGSVRGRRWHG